MYGHTKLNSPITPLQLYIAMTITEGAVWKCSSFSCINYCLHNHKSVFFRFKNLGLYADVSCFGTQRNQYFISIKVNKWEHNNNKHLETGLWNQVIFCFENRPPRVCARRGQIPVIFHQHFIIYRSTSNSIIN